jgi:hypothetical protein
MYPDGAHLTDLKEVRDILYKMQRPGIAPKVSCDFGIIYTFSDMEVHQLVYPHDWQVKASGQIRVEADHASM